jgi:hypothetical protein
MTNLDSFFLNRSKRGERVSAPTPAGGAARFFFLAYTHFAKLVGVNLLFLLFCIPIVTIPAALSGMNRVCMLLVREGTAGVWSDFTGEFRCSFLKSLPLGLLCAFLFADAALCLFLGMTAGYAGLMPILLLAAAVLAIAALLLGCALFALMPLVALKNGDILRDALYLVMKEPKTDLLLIAVVGGSLTAAVLLLPYSIPVVAVIGLSLVSLASCTILYGPVKKHILDKANEIS